MKNYTTKTKQWFCFCKILFLLCEKSLLDVEEISRKIQCNPIIAKDFQSISHIYTSLLLKKYIPNLKNNRFLNHPGTFSYNFAKLEIGAHLLQSIFSEPWILLFYKNIYLISSKFFLYKKKKFLKSWITTNLLQFFENVAFVIRNMYACFYHVSHYN